ncbi:NADAR family protein [Clostridium sp. SHJSY1]|uniref:NADAR family protein n=1 Tax=Clostridium sp. SHJSY1 TaxID=2942483 RepID=UPI0028740CA7|nr:NADAR family protein [Clostridium sp. SHJSY1]MDS0525502.1 NADAR family protein [Clostridium sp. SHJSY1]
MKDIYSINNPMAPLWIKYPQINRYSLGWRMGFGESYVVKFGEWYESLNNEEKKEYKEMFPEPKGWLGWYEEVFDRDIYDEDVLLWDKDRNMKYSLENVQADFKKSKKNKFLFFWGHQLSRDGSITKTALSQWWKSDFVVDIDTYSCMEQYMMAEKARLFGDEEILEKIMNSKYPKQIKELGRKIKNFDEEIWTKNKYSIILNGNYAKFTQNEDLREFLIGTKNRILVEASPYDKVWGIGMSSDDINIENPLTWKGLNLLGFALMEVRDEIIKVYENYNKLK